MILEKQARNKQLKKCVVYTRSRTPNFKSETLNFKDENPEPFTHSQLTLDLSAVEAKVTYISNGVFSMEVDGTVHQVSGNLDNEDDDKKQLTCEVDGVKTKASIVQNGDSLHLFTAVSFTCLPPIKPLSMD